MKALALALALVFAAPSLAQFEVIAPTAKTRTALTDGQTVLVHHADGSLRAYRDGAWTALEAPAPASQLAAAGGYVYALAPNGELRRHDGRAWAFIGSEQLIGWGAMGPMLHTLGIEGHLKRFDGASWKTLDVDRNTRFAFEDGAGTVYALKADRVHRYTDRDGWSLVPDSDGTHTIVVEQGCLLAHKKDKREVWRLRDGRWTVTRVEDGELTAGTCPMLRARDGSVWMLVDEIWSKVPDTRCGWLGARGDLALIVQGPNVCLGSVPALADAIRKQRRFEALHGVP